MLVTGTEGGAGWTGAPLAASLVPPLHRVPLCAHLVLTLEAQPLAWSEPVRAAPETDLMRGDWAPRGKGLTEVVATMGLVTMQVAFLGAVPPSGGSGLPHPHCSSVFPPIKWADCLGAAARLSQLERLSGGGVSGNHNHLTGWDSAP